VDSSAGSSEVTPRLTLAGLIGVLCLLAVLATVALPRLAGDASSSDDAPTLRRVRAAAERVERCRARTGDYTRCTGGTDAGPRGVLVVSRTPDSYIVQATSLGGTTFQLARGPNGVRRTCWGAPSDVCRRQAASSTAPSS
jgi:hypothetical protein